MFQASFNTVTHGRCSPTSHLCGSSKQPHAVYPYLGNDIQPMQMDNGAPFSTGTITLHAAGDGYGANDGLDVSFNLASLSIQAVVNTTPVVIYINGIGYNSYTFTTDHSIQVSAGGTSQYCFYKSGSVTTYYYKLTDNANNVTWTDANGVSTSAPPSITGYSVHPQLGANPFTWLENARVLRMKFTSTYAGATFRVVASSFHYASTTITDLTIVDDQHVVSNTLGSGNLAITTSDTYQQPLPIDDDTVVSIGTQGRIFTNNPSQPGTGRIHRAFASPYNGAYTGAYLIKFQIKDHIQVASYIGTGLAGQVFKVTVPGGGPATTISWNHFGWLQCSWSVSKIAQTRLR